MAKKWSEIQHKSTPEQQQQAQADLDKQYNRFYWRLVRLWDRLTK